MSSETLPKITLEKLERGDDYPTPYRAHIIGPGYDHHGEAETPERALMYAASHWARQPTKRRQPPYRGREAPEPCALQPTHTRGRQMTEWKDIETAPKDGTAFKARIPGHGSDNIIAWMGGLLNSEGDDCGGWYFAADQEPPESWTDGICWEVNEDGVKSTEPTHWAPITEGVE